MEGEFYERVHALECEFAERFKPLFEKVRRIILFCVVITLKIFLNFYFGNYNLLEFLCISHKLVYVN